MEVKKVSKIIFLTIIQWGFILHSEAQAQKKRLPNNINIPTYSHVYPSIRADGQYMILMSNYTNDGDYALKFTKRDERGAWENPEPIENIYKARLDHFGSYCLSHDGMTLLFSSARAKGIGGYDLWYSIKRGRYWSEPKNFGKPVNSTGHEGNPSLSPDGKTLYFMRCKTMDENNEGNCKIYYATRKSATKWSDPIPLPEPVNIGNELNPRILIDNKTLIFASDRSGGKGKLDLYMSKKEDEKWSQPVPLTYINTPKNDEFISMTAKGDIAFYTDAYKGHFNIFIARVPEELRPEPVILMTGKVVMGDTLTPAGGALIKAFDLHSGKLFTAEKASESYGTFFLALPGGTTYDFSVFPKDAGYDYHVGILELDSLEKSDWIKPVVTLHALLPDHIIPLPGICFEEISDTTVQVKYAMAIRRLAAFLKRNPGLRVEINVFPDSIPLDTIVSENFYNQDTTMYSPDSSLVETETNAKDSIFFEADTTYADSLTNIAAPVIPDPSVITSREALAVKSALQELGVNPDRVMTKGHDTPNDDFPDGNGEYPRILLKIIE